MDNNELVSDFSSENTVAPRVTDVSWLRNRRKLAATPEQHHSVSVDIVALAHSIETRQIPLTAGRYVILGVGAILAGIILSIVLLISAGAMTDWLQS